ncbi:hypothetical protein Tco_0464261 [Tanacetum coccineum]
MIPLSRGSFDVIVGMDWLSKRKFVDCCHREVVRIPLEGDEILRVHRERTLGAAKALMNAKVDEPRISDILVVCDFIDVFPEELSMTPRRQVEFHIGLVHGATLVAKSPYRLAPSEMQELFGQLQELQDKGEYEYEIRYHPGKANVVVDALSRKERVKPRRMHQDTTKSVRERLDLRTALHPQRGGQTIQCVASKLCMVGNVDRVLWAKIGRSSLIRPALVQETTDKTLCFVEELVEIMDREVKSLKRSRIPLMKVRWNSKHVKSRDEISIRRGYCDNRDLSRYCLEAACASGGSPAGIHGLFSGWYCGLASRKVTLGVSMAWAKGVTTGTLVLLMAWTGWNADIKDGVSVK